MHRILYLTLNNQQVIPYAISYSNKGYLYYGQMKSYGDLERIFDSTKALIQEHAVTHVFCIFPKKGFEEYRAMIKLALLQLGTSYDTKLSK
jgi:hypothetical protein